MGWNIVRRMHPDEPGMHNRLWVKEEIEDILVNELGTEETKCLTLENTDLHPAIIMEGLRKMKEIRFLYVQKGRGEWKVDEVSQYLPDALRSLCWPKYPFPSLPKTFRAKKLVNLEMGWSNISQLWERGERKVLDKLKYLDLTGSKLRTFDLGMAPHLEKLVLEVCRDFEELHILNECPKLKFLCLTYCKVSNLNLGMTPHIEELNLQGCNDFIELHMPVKCSNLKDLNLSGSKVSSLKLGMTPHLEKLSLRDCYDFVELHMSIECSKLKYLDLTSSKVSSLNLGMTPHLKTLKLQRCYCLQEIITQEGCLKKLEYLSLEGCSRFDYFLVNERIVFPGLDSLAELQLNACPLGICPRHPNNNLPKFKFECFYDEPLPSSSGNIEKLLSFGLCACTNIESFSASISGLRHLRVLSLEGMIPEVPNDLGQIQSLEKLSLGMEKIKHLPERICMLKHLKYLELKSCRLLDRLPKDLGRLECLEELHLTGGKSLQDIPNSICKMKSLTYLNLSQCHHVEKLPEEQCSSLRDIPNGICKMKSLTYLNLFGCNKVEKLPEEVGCLECLEKLDLSHCRSLRDIID